MSVWGVKRQRGWLLRVSPVYLLTFYPPAILLIPLILDPLLGSSRDSGVEALAIELSHHDLSSLGESLGPIVILTVPSPFGIFGRRGGKGRFCPQIETQHASFSVPHP